MQAHTCHFPGCKRVIAPKFWGCPMHWYTLPKELRDKIWRVYRPGQEITKDPSDEYIKVAKEVDAWCRAYIRDNISLKRNFNKEIEE